MDEPMKRPTMNNISAAAEEAVSEAETSGRAQVFVDCDPEYRQAKITVGSSFRTWNPKGTETYCAEYTGRAVPLTAVYLHEVAHPEPRLNAGVARDKITDALENEWDLYVGYHTPEPEAIPRSAEDLNWAARTAHGIHGKRSVSLWKERSTKPGGELYFLWVSAEMPRRDPPGAVQKVTDLCEFDGDYDYKEVAGRIAKAVRRYLVVDDPNPLWSHNCFQHHMQYRCPPKA